MKKFIDSLPKLMRIRQTRRNSGSVKSMFGLNESSIILVIAERRLLRSKADEGTTHQCVSFLSKLFTRVCLGKPTKPFIPPVSINLYRLRLGVEVLIVRLQRRRPASLAIVPVAVWVGMGRWVDGFGEVS